MDIGAEEITEWHMERGWSGIGYNFVIKRDGTLESGRDLDGDGNVIEETGAHARGFNKDSIGVCLAGGRGDDGKPAANFTHNQLTTLRTLINVIRAYNEVEVMGHRDLPGVTKTCPCFDVWRWFNLGEEIEV